VSDHAPQQRCGGTFVEIAFGQSQFEQIIV
jgi:hypothetical protein